MTLVSPDCANPISYQSTFILIYNQCPEWAHLGREFQWITAFW